MKAKKWGNLLAFASMILVNVLAETMRLGNSTTGEIAERYLNLFTPAGFTFAIWGVIYALLAVFVFRQWNDLSLRGNVGWLFVGSCVLNAGWLVAWHEELLGLAVVIIAGLLLTLLAIEDRLGGSLGGGTAQTLVRAGFDLYCGWIISATIGSAATWLTQIGWNGFGLSEAFWTVVVTLFGAAVTTAFVVQKKRALVGAAVIWAYIGILTRQLSATGFNGRYPAVVAAAAFGIAAITVSILSALFAPRQAVRKRARS